MNSASDKISIPDASELTLDELREYGERYQASLASDYYNEMMRLYLAAAYPNTESGWHSLRDEAWATARLNNEVRKEIVALNELRRSERLAQQGAEALGEELAMPPAPMRGSDVAAGQSLKWDPQSVFGNKSFHDINH